VFGGDTQLRWVASSALMFITGCSSVCFHPGRPTARAYSFYSSKKHLSTRMRPAVRHR